mmetsp:Transcript_5846/g.16947  ORF Transcript_5846/g.16947 Transcript_5846/m.16947 type:complete len:216 (-) Transcript_5846:1328-1975(-)
MAAQRPLPGPSAGAGRSRPPRNGIGVRRPRRAAPRRSSPPCRYCPSSQRSRVGSSPCTGRSWSAIARRRRGRRSAGRRACRSCRRSWLRRCRQIPHARWRSSRRSAWAKSRSSPSPALVPSTFPGPRNTRRPLSRSCASRQCRRPAARGRLSTLWDSSRRRAPRPAPAAMASSGRWRAATAPRASPCSASSRFSAGCSATPWWGGAGACSSTLGR